VYLLDTDHLSILERGGAESLTLSMRLSGVAEMQIVSCIVVYEEQMRGWLAEGARARTTHAMTLAYEDLTENLKVHCNMTLLPFDDFAAVRFDELKKAKINIGTQDLKIAAIALVNDATVLTRNSRHFSKVPDLRIEDWTV
jgi:tRNA(fMet)-specific endonuclease VapC